MRRIVSILLENQPGALSRVVGLFSQRGYNIDTLNVNSTLDPTLSRLTLTTFCDEQRCDQIGKQLQKLIEVLEVTIGLGSESIENEIVILHVKGLTSLLDLKSWLEIKGAAILEIRNDLCIVRYVAQPQEVSIFLDELRGSGQIVSVVRSGSILLPS